VVNVIAMSFPKGKCRTRRTAVEPAKVGFLFVGGAHQMLHLAPVAVELARQGRVAVHLFVGVPEDEAALRAVLQRLRARIPITLLPTPFWARVLPNIRARWAALKLPRIFAGRRMLRGMDVLVTAERTSTILKRLPGRAPALVHIPHGAGDRAQGFEPRIRLFDHVIVAGPKDRDRMVAAGLVTPDRCTVSGYIKLDAVRSLHERQLPARLFANDLPTILYNPHFAPGLSSWDAFGPALVRDILADGGFNLILAPHVRLRERLSLAEQDAIRSFAADPRIIVDLGSERSSDMTYTHAADIYVGDVSSQVYEFVHRSRPCVFLNATGQDHDADPDFHFWSFGEVVVRPDDALRAIHAAPARHPEYAALQAQSVERAFGSAAGSGAVANAAATISGIVAQCRRKGAVLAG
jgi:hypothetical protein